MAEGYVADPFGSADLVAKVHLGEQGIEHLRSVSMDQPDLLFMWLHPALIIGTPNFIQRGQINLPK